MKFTISSSDLLRGLNSVSRAISSKSQIPILDNFLFVLTGNVLEITASDLELTLKTTLEIENVSEEGSIAVPAKYLTDTLREFPDMPLALTTNNSDKLLKISWATGDSNIPFFPAEDYPALPALEEVTSSFVIPADILLTGINATVYATAEEELRPVMNGIYFDMTTDNITLVASDSHKLIYYKRNDISVNENSSFILPKKPATILKSLLSRSEDDVKITFDQKNAYFKFDGTVLICRLVEGNYPSYKSVIPKNNPNRMVIPRIELLNGVKRVAVCSNQATSHIKFALSNDQITISAQDLSFSVSAHETLNCQYDGDELEIGFKSTFLVEILSNLPYEEICFELADQTKAGLIVAAGDNDPNEEICSLLMPIRIPS